jgi:amino acid adenylation domain-containing protein
VKAADAERKKLPIGKMMANTTSYVLDGRLEPVAVGVAGEMYIGGEGLARGYRSNPEQTAEKFIPNPYSRVAGARMYWTGDLLRYTRGGEMEFVGRADEQVKVRGYRIEPAEIRDAIIATGDVEDAVVLVREEADRGKRLVAYLVMEEGGSVEAVKRRVREKLPEYMVPNQYVSIEQIPLTANGKIDRAKLAQMPDQQQSEQLTTADHGQIKRPVEEIVEGIWCEVLGLKSVGLDDNFFEMGGHSLLATQMVSRVRKVFDVKVELRSVFERPSIRAIAEEVEAAIAEGRMSKARRIERGERGATERVSYAQERLWFIDQMEEGKASYNIPAAVRMVGDLDVEALEKSLNEIVRRHEVLRTVFAVEEGEPVQVIRPAEEMKLEVEDWSQRPEKEAEVEAIVRQEAARGFDLQAGPLLRVRMLRLSKDEHVLVVVMHHIISDGWSIGVMIREIAALYEAYKSGAESPLEELEIQYADYAVWQREWLQGEELDRQMSYWRKQLEGAPAVLEMPTDRARPAVQSHRGSSHRVWIDQETTRGLKEMSRSEGVTLYMTLMAAYAVLLMRYTHQEEVVVGSPVANRNHREIEPLIGFFVNMLVMRTDLSGEPVFREVLRRVREVTLGAYAHQDLPFEKLVEQMQPDRSLSYSPIFQSLFVLQNAPMGELELSDLKLELLEIGTQVVQFDMSLAIVEQEGRLAVTWSYSSDLFDQATIERMASHYKRIQEEVIANAGQRVADIRLLSEAEEYQIAVEWNNSSIKYTPAQPLMEAAAADDRQSAWGIGIPGQQEEAKMERCNYTEADYSPRMLMHELFEAQAERTPDACAVTFGPDHLTYRELNFRSNQMGHYLIARGVGPESLVSICMERCLEMVITMLGVLKAGGAYVPLDPSYPKERLNYMVEDSRAGTIVVQQGLLEYFTQRPEVIICLDSEWDCVAEQSGGKCNTNAHPENPAYVIYTSGSIGEPKGVVIPHNAVYNHMLWIERCFPSTETGKILQKTPFGFDASVWEIYKPLLAGERLIMAQPGGHRDSQYLIQTVVENDISTLQLVPSQLRMMLADDDFKKCTSLRRVFCGGESLPAELQKTLHELLGAEVINLYGPTEATIDASFYVPKRDIDTQYIPIGSPIANMRLYVADKGMKIAPVNVTEELYIGGKGLARCYGNDAELTAEKFIPDPFSEASGERMYKTGDLAKHNSKGEIEYVGRVDKQVKIRGYRIEPAEIERVVMEETGATEAVVVAMEEETGDKRLVAYLVGEEATEEQEREIIRRVKGKLPDYMVPRRYVWMKQMPLTNNGKVNLKALPTPNYEVVAGRNIAPRTLAEEIIAGIWESVLRREIVSVEDDFFDLGGHSLLALQVLARIRRELGAEVELKQLFDTPTVEGLARIVEKGRREGEVVEEIKRVSRERRLPLSYTQQRLWFIDQLEPGNAAYNIPAALRLTGNLNIAALEKTLNEIMRRHEVLRTVFSVEEKEPVQVIKQAEIFKLEVEDLSSKNVEEREAEAERIAREEAETSFDLQAGPLLRVRLLKLADTDHVLVFTMHHIISDGWSIGVLVREFVALYESYVKGEEPPLPELPVQYADFAVWQRDLLGGKTKQVLLDYWKRQLGGQLSTLELPMDHPRLPVRRFEGAIYQESLPDNLVEGLKQLSRREGVSSFMALLAAFQTLLHRYSGQEDIVIGADIAGRNRVELEGLIGNFVNVLVLRTHINGDMKFRDLLQRVRDVTLGAFSHQNMPFDKLVEELQPSRDLSLNPLVQAVLSFQSFPPAELEAPGLQIRAFEFLSNNDLASKKWDLGLFVAEKDSSITLSWTYNTDLFFASTISRISHNFVTLLGNVITNPDAPIYKLEILTEEQQAEKKTQRVSRKASLRSRLRATDLAPDVASKTDFVRVNYIEPDQTLPLVIQPDIDGFDVIEWAKGNREFIKESVLKSGAVLFRGCNVNSPVDFEELAHVICPDLFGEYGDLPRERESSKVYGSTPYPSDQVILFHNESSHMNRWPLNIFFYCVTSAQEGGETPLLDCRKTYSALDPKVRERFARKHLMYVRNFTDDLDVNWQGFFRTSDKAVVEKRCKEAGIEIEWKKDGGLRMRQLSRAVAEHPKTHEMVFFNQILLHHVSCLAPSVRDSVLSLFSEEDLPRNVYYGDGEPIEPDLMEEIQELYFRTAVQFPWQVGDVLVVDNMLTAHARSTFVGPRKILVAMGEMFSDLTISR